MVNHARRLELVVDRTTLDEGDAGEPASAVQESQIRRRYELPSDTHDPHQRPTLKTPPPRLGLGAIPRRLVGDREMRSLPLDHRAAFVLSHVDGRTNLRSLIDVTGLVADEVVALIERLIELKAVATL